MQPLLYDFGQVAGEAEKDYITQIVASHVSILLDYNTLQNLYDMGIEFVETQKEKKNPY